MRMHIDQENPLHTRHAAGVDACRWHARAAAARSGVVVSPVMPVGLTAKINPSGVPGGYPNKGAA
jgi:hypothetical protein